MSRGQDLVAKAIRRRPKALPCPKHDGQMHQRSTEFASCKLCGFDICLNNYDDAVCRIPKYKGVVVCPFCWHRSKTQTARRIREMLLVDQMRSMPCLKVLVARQVNWVEPEPCGKCPTCVARRI